MQNVKPIQVFSVIPSLPTELEALRTIAYNLCWAWNHETIELFRRLDRDLWETSRHNPVLMLGTIEQSKLEDAARDEAFLAHLQRVEAELEAYCLRAAALVQQTVRVRERWNGRLVAYFSAEFGITECLSIFAGGLGMLAGDHLKSASDLGLPLTGVGLLYQQGYFRQYLNQAGWQQEAYEDNDFHNLPVSPACDPAGKPLVISGGSTRPSGVCAGLASAGRPRSRSICWTPTSHATHAPRTGISPTSSTAATAKRASGRKSCWASAAIGRWKRWESSRRCIT